MPTQEKNQLGSACESAPPFNKKHMDYECIVNVKLPPQDALIFWPRLMIPFKNLQYLSKSFAQGFQEELKGQRSPNLKPVSQGKKREYLAIVRYSPSLIMIADIAKYLQFLEKSIGMKKPDLGVWLRV